MRIRAFTRGGTEGLSLSGRRLPAFPSDARRLLAAAALLHVALAFGLFCAGRARVAPALINRDGLVGSFALDSYHYQRDAARLVETFGRDGAAAWARAGEPLHAKLISILFVLLGPLFGNSTLSAEPFNLLCYVAVVGLTLALGREVGGARAGKLAAWVVALWPTFLLHTLQLLKDTLFVAAALALVLCVTTWLTRDYGPRGAAAAGALTAAAVLVLLFVRPNFAVFVCALVIVGLVLLVARQLIERRALYWNTACPALTLAAGATLLLASHSARDLQKFKHYPSDWGGQPKSAAGVGERVPTLVSYLPRVRPDEAGAGRLRAAADRAALRIGSMRYRFAALYSESGSNIDSGVRLRRPADVLLYLPRAFAIGWWAPFPNTWATAGTSVGVAGKLLSGAETLVIYAFELLALAAVLRPPRRLAAWLLLSTSAFGAALLALVVPNVGALYRFRYTFWVLLIVLGSKGFEAARDYFKRAGSGRRESIKGAAAFVSLVCLLAVVCACSSRAARDEGTAGRAPRAQGAPPSGEAAAPFGVREGGLGFDLNNFTGSTLRAVYVSPSESDGWEENVLGADELSDGAAVRIRFSPEERAALWDVRVEAPDGTTPSGKGWSCAALRE